MIPTESIGRSPTSRSLHLTALTITLCLLSAVPVLGGPGRSGAIDAANAAKDDFASNNGSSGVPRSGQPAARAETRVLKVTVVDVHEDGTITVRAMRPPALGNDGGDLTIRLLEAPLTAQDKKQFGGRKTLNAADLEVGHHLKITYRTETMEIVKVKVLRSRATL